MVDTIAAYNPKTATVTGTVTFTNPTGSPVKVLSMPPRLHIVSTVPKGASTRTPGAARAAR